MTTPTTPGEILAGNITAARGRRRLQQSDLADRMRALGWKWVRQTVGEVENNRRRLTAEEVFGLAIALEVAIPQLLGPSDPDEDILLPGGLVISAASAERLAGRGLNDRSVRWNGNDIALVARRHDPPGTDPLDFGEDAFAVPPGIEAKLTAAARPPIVAAIVTSPLGVLVGKRNDGKPPWTFISGEREPGERSEDTAIREVKEETGLHVRAGQVIGERDHPKTGRHMIYLAASPTHGTDVFVGDEEELAEVRWVSPAELDSLMGAGNIFEPVRGHLARELGEAGD